MIQPIQPASLRDAYLSQEIYPDLIHTHYWSDHWDPVFYIELARAGFIAISIEHPDLGQVLLPEIQRNYALLDWDDLHRSRTLRRLIRSQRVADEGLELRIGTDCSAVLEGVAAHHGSQNWLRSPYPELLDDLQQHMSNRFTIRSTELWSTRRDELIAGELGYTIGTTYTSLSGFCRMDDPQWSRYGALQLDWLGRILRDRGYAFWNLGHTSMQYKFDLGAQSTPRIPFLQRWLAVRDDIPSEPIEVETRFPFSADQ